MIVYIHKYICSYLVNPDGNECMVLCSTTYATQISIKYVRKDYLVKFVQFEDILLLMFYSLRLANYIKC